MKNFIIFLLLVTLMLQNGESSLSGLGKRQPGDKFLEEFYYETNDTVKPENHFIHINIPKKYPIITFVHFQINTFLTTSVAQYDGTRLNSVEFTAYNTTEFALIMRLYGYEGETKLNVENENISNKEHDDFESVKVSDDINEYDYKPDPYLANLFSKRKKPTSTTTESSITISSSSFQFKLNRIISIFGFILIIFL